MIFTPLVVEPHPLQTLAARVKISSNRRNLITSYQISLGFRGFWRLELDVMMVFFSFHFSIVLSGNIFWTMKLQPTCD